MLPYYTSLGFRSSVLTKVQQTHKLSSALGIGDCCQAVTRGEVIHFASRIENWVIDTEVLPVLVIDASGNKLPVRGCISRTRGCSAFFAFAVLLFRSQRWSRDGSLTTNRGLSSFFCLSWSVDYAPKPLPLRTPCICNDRVELASSPAMGAFLRADSVDRSDIFTTSKCAKIRRLQRSERQYRRIHEPSKHAMERLVGKLANRSQWNLKTCLQNAEEGDIFEICNTVSVLSLEMARRENIESTDSKCFCFQKSKD